MKQRSTTPAFFSIDALAWSVAIAFSIAIILAALAQTHAGAESNSENQARIDELTKSIDEQVDKTRTLNKQSASIESQIGALSKERQYLNQQISKNTQDQSALEQRIVVTEKELELRRSVLGSVMADLYVSDSISSIELLASSGSVADFIDNQTNNEAAQSQLTTSIASVKDVVTDLAKQKQVLAQVVGDQENQKIALDEKKDEQESILVATQGQSGDLQEITAEMAAERKKLQSQQQASITAQMGDAEMVAPGTISTPVTEQVPEAEPVTSVPSAEPSTPTTSPPKPKPKPTPRPPVVLSNGGYPRNLQNCFVDANALSYGIDPWGYGCRQCVSYTAWKVLQKTGRPAMYWGNAKDWPSSARRAGYTSGSTPRAGSIGVMTSGPYGHVAWVERVNANGTLNISQYNYYLPNKGNGGWGWYSEFRNVSPRTYNTYIYI